jgi:hypothetical protein
MSIFTIFINALNNTIKSSLTFFKIIILSRPVKKFPQAEKNNCIVIGNGPSLNSSIEKYKEKLQLLDCMCVNFFGNTDFYEVLKPKLYIINATWFFVPNTEEKFIESRKILFKNIIEKTTWKVDIFIPVQVKRHREWIDYLLKNKNISIRYYNQTPVEGLSSLAFAFFNARLGMPRPHNVIIPSLFVAIGMKYKKIFILGADHSWLKEISVDNDNNVLINQKHFYDENSSQALAMKRLDKGNRKMWEVLEKFLLTFKGYHITDEYSKKLNIKIYNATPNSYIDAFERYHQDLNLIENN